jgi:hypothetical protein
LEYAQKRRESQSRYDSQKKSKRAKTARFNGSGGKFLGHGEKVRAARLILVDLTVPADPGQHDGSQVGFEEPVCLGQGIIQPGAFFKLISIHIGLREHLLGGSAALGAH